MRTLGFPDDVREPLSLFRDDAPLKAHPAYRAAKAGDMAAALKLVGDLARPLAEWAKASFKPGAIYVAPHAQEASGDNAIPQTLAQVISSATGGTADEEIVQKTRVFHTGADPMERLNSRAEFDGEIRAGGSYVLVDDVTTMGGTLAELAHYIQANGGTVIGAVVMVNAARSGRLAADKKVVAELERRHGDAIREVFRVDPAALTADEAQYLIGFRTADEIRNRSTKAGKETNRRLRAKGVAGMGGGTE